MPVAVQVTQRNGHGVISNRVGDGSLESTVTVPQQHAHWTGKAAVAALTLVSHDEIGMAVSIYIAYRDGKRPECAGGETECRSKVCRRWLCDGNGSSGQYQNCGEKKIETKKGFASKCER